MEQSSKLNVDPKWNAVSSDVLSGETIARDYVRFDQMGDCTNQSTYTVWTNDRSANYQLDSAFLAVKVKVTTANGGTLDAVSVAGAISALASNGWAAFKSVRVSVEENEVVLVDRPAMLSHLVNLVENSAESMEKYGPLAHQFVDSASDGHSTAVEKRDHSIYVGADNSAGAVGYWPSGMYDETQYYLTAADPAVLSGSTALPTVIKNPSFDPAFKVKADRSAAGAQWIRLPLSDISGLFATDRIMKGSKIQIELVKNQDAEALFGDLNDALLEISRVQLWIAKAKPSVFAAANYSAQLAKDPVIKTMYTGRKFLSFPLQAVNSGNQTLHITHSVNKPTSVIVAFGYTDRLTDRRLNPLQFDLHSSISSIELRANGSPVPNQAYNPSDDITQILLDLYQLGGKDRDPAESPVLTYKNWSEMFPIYGFNLEYLEGSAYESRTIMNLDLNYFFASNVASAYTIYVLINHEVSGSFDYSSGETRLRVSS